jgi:LPXTG-motif cell wall-anchored protein
VAALGEEMTGAGVVGGAMILGGAMLVLTRRTRAPSAYAEEALPPQPSSR